MTDQSEEEFMPKIGDIYRHYRGTDYMVICVANHHFDGEKVVCYQSLNGDQIWCRPIKDFEKNFEGPLCFRY